MFQRKAPRLVLASGSASRRALLEAAGLLLRDSNLPRGRGGGEGGGACRGRRSGGRSFDAGRTRRPSGCPRELGAPGVGADQILVL